MTQFVRSAALIAAYVFVLFAQYLTGHYMGADIIQTMFPEWPVKEPGALHHPLFWAVVEYFVLVGFLKLMFGERPAEDGRNMEALNRRAFHRKLWFLSSFVFCAATVIGLRLNPVPVGWAIVIIDVAGAVAVGLRVWLWLPKGLSI